MKNDINGNRYSPSYNSLKSNFDNTSQDTFQEKTLSTNDIKDSFTDISYNDKSLTSSGKLSIIISNKNKKNLNTFRDKIKKEIKEGNFKLKDDLSFIDGFSAEVAPEDLKKIIKSLPEGSSVSLDNKIEYIKQENSGEDISEFGNSTMDMDKLWDKGYTGKGVGICVIDSGLYPHRDFEGRIKKFYDINQGKEQPYDSYGHGTLVTGIAAGAGTSSAGKYKGIAPEADIISVRITSVAEAIKAIQWATENKEKYNIKVMNISLGDVPLNSYKEDPFSQAVEKAWDMGITVVAAAGNEGPEEGSISTPGIDPKIITVGYIDDQKTSNRDDDIIANKSSRGPTSPDNIQKPDVVAPGVNVIGTVAPEAEISKLGINVDNNYMAYSGSSMATPIVSGVAALLLQANPKLSPNDVKSIITQSADQYIPNLTQKDQGAGLIDPMESLEVALGNKEPEDCSNHNDIDMNVSDDIPKEIRKKAENY